MLLHLLREGRGRLAVYFTRVYNPVWTNPDGFSWIEVLTDEFEPPNNVGQAGQSGIAVGAISPDRNNAEAVWFWVAADNVRLAAENALMVARQLA